ncbi:hypothetical protein Tco_0683101 [Tanacetum coccineum]|uniref:Reverse transcriptase domain-containing protein n=1 Tax=Tanacetum coccineum TaxID=301880 RepID=A0ABQ4XUM5_9ASTR
MSADSAVTYTSVHSEARSWSIPSEDPYEEAARQLLEQAPRSPEYVPENHIPVYIPEPEHPEDLVPAEDEAPTPLLPPSFLSPRRVRVLHTTSRLTRRIRAAVRSTSLQLRDCGAAQCVPQRQAAVDLAVLNHGFPRPWRLELVNGPKETTKALIDQGVVLHMAEFEAECNAGLGPYLNIIVFGYNSNGSGPRPAQTARECSYSEFLKCKPLDFKGTEGVVELTRWFEKMESVFSISNCPAASQNVPEEKDNIEKYIGGLPDMILGSVKASKSKTMQEDIEFTTELMEEKTHAYAERQAERKRKNDDLSKNNQN